MLLCAHSAGVERDRASRRWRRTGPREIPEQEIARARARRAAARRRHAARCTCRRRGRTRLRFLAGQSVDAERRRRRRRRAARPTPIASCPCDDRNLHFHVAPRRRRRARAELLFDGAIRAGEHADLWGPTGEFVLAESERPLAFLACDTGFAPIKSLIEHAMAVDAAESLSLDWLATRPDGHYLANQCRAWAAAFDEFRYAAHAADADPAAGARAAGRGAWPRRCRWPRCDVYVAGPARVRRRGGARRWRRRRAGRSRSSRLVGVKRDGRSARRSSRSSPVTCADAGPATAAAPSRSR